MAAIRLFNNGSQELLHLTLRIGMLKDRQTKRGFGDKEITLDQFKALCSTVSMCFIIACDYRPLAPVVQTNLGTTKNVTSWV